VLQKQTNCYVCEHRRPLVGDYHSRCVNYTATVQQSKHGVEQGWCWWPHNFDPIWINSCDGFKEKEKA
jgi:hypothetical protein